MKWIIPLAGPDFILKDGTIRPLYKVENEPLLLKVLYSRPWYISGEVTESDIIIVVRATEMTADFMRFIGRHLPLAKVVTVSHLTSGSLLSSLAAISQINDYAEPICVDLADIVYESEYPFVKAFEDPSIHGLIPFFNSNRECYSYLDIINGKVVKTIEKKVISSHASVGTYFFKDTPTFLECAAFSMRAFDTVSYKNNLFVCPSYNALIAMNKNVLPVEVEKVISLSEQFH